jgi:hypothetical protein
MSGEIQKTQLQQTLNQVLKWDWEKVALVGIIALAVANILIFVRERKGVK